MGDGRFTVVLSFIETDGHTEIVLALAALSAYLKQQSPDVRVELLPIHSLSRAFEHSPRGYAERVADCGADLLAISCLSPDWPALDSYLWAVKGLLPTLSVVVGGYQAILAPEETAAHPVVSFVCIGDGEQPLVDLVWRLRSGGRAPIAGLWESLDDGSIRRSEPVITADLAAMPFPDYSLFEHTGALKGHSIGAGGRFALPVMSGRGCPYRCTYCSNTSLLDQWRGKGSYLRKYDAATLIEELKRLRRRYRVEYFEFWDELFLFNMRYATDLLERYRREIALPFSITSRSERMDEAFCRLAAEAGCDLIWFGIESGSESYRRRYLNRNVSNRELLEAAETCRRFGIRRLTFNMVGMPFESAEQMLETLELNRMIRPEFFYFFTYLPLPGTSLYDLARRHGLLRPHCSSDYQEGGRSGRFRSNLLAHDGAPDEEAFQAVCERLQALQRELEAQAPQPPAAVTVGGKVGVGAHFPFPLSVYAGLLELEKGRVDDLHFGFFDAQHRDVVEAQRASTEQILARIPAIPQRILEVGIGVGSTYRRLRALGHRVTGITPDAAQLEEARQRLGEAADLRCVAFEELEVEAGGFDLILLQESSQYINPLQLFHRAHQMLAEGGHLLLVDEVALRRDGWGGEPLHLVSDFVAQAVRCGFSVEEQVDFSAAAAGTIDYLLDALARRRGELIAMGYADEPALDGLATSLCDAREGYAVGRCGYAMLSLRRQAPPRWQVVKAGESHWAGLVALFKSAFGESLDEAVWRWKYGGGRGRSLVAVRDGRVIAHYGGTERRILDAGVARLAVQVGDVMVEPGERGSLARQGPFFRVAATFLERYVGFGRRYGVGFGFPNRRAMRVAERLGLYGEVEEMVEVRWPPLERGVRPGGDVVIQLLHDNESGRQRVEAAWRVMAADLSDRLVGIRDWDWVRYRYLRHPCRDYRVFALVGRADGETRGVCVLRPDGEVAWLVDLICSLDRLPEMVRYARWGGAALGATRLRGWVGASHADRFLVDEGVFKTLDVRVPTSTWTAGPPAASLQGRWWLMAGDTDFL